MSCKTKNVTFSRRFENTVYGSVAVLTIMVAALLLNAAFSGPMIV